MSYDDSDDIRSLILSPRRNSDEEGDEWGEWGVNEYLEIKAITLGGIDT